MKLSIPAGTTSKRIAIFIQDSSSTTGAGLTGLLFNTASLTCYSWIDTDGNAAGTVQALQTATRGTWTTRGFVEKDATNMPGWYELGVPDALLAVGVKWATVHLKGATNMAPLPIEMEVTANSNQDAVRGGMTALPNANAAGAGGLPTGDATNSVKIQTPLKKNTALTKFEFLMTDSTNHNPATGKTVSVTRSIDGGAFAAGTLSGVTEVANGIYYVDFAAADLNGNCITLRATATACDDLDITLFLEP